MLLVCRVPPLQLKAWVDSHASVTLSLRLCVCHGDGLTGSHAARRSASLSAAVRTTRSTSTATSTVTSLSLRGALFECLLSTALLLVVGSGSELEV